jgi:hypothetical protein
MYTKKFQLTEKLFHLASMLILGAIFMTSCISDSEDTNVQNNSCYISSISFNDFRKKVVGKASDGVSDSTYYTTYTATQWVWTIDHRTLTIENRDSLPYDTDLSRVVMNMSYVGGIAYHRASDAWDEDPWISYSSTDSIDLRTPLHIKVVATDNTERKYTLRINIHTMQSDTLKWIPVHGNEYVDGTHPMKAIKTGNEIAVMTNNGQAVMWNTHASSNLGEWDSQATDLPVSTDVLSLVKASDLFFANTTDGDMYTSADGISWTLADTKNGLRIVGASNDKIYTIFDNAIHSTGIDNITWKQEQIDEDASLLPNKEIVALTYAQTTQQTRMILLGNRDEASDTCAVVWSKSWAEFEDENEEVWMHYNRSWINTKQLPKFSQLNLIHYDNMLIMAGGESTDGKIKSLESFYYSKDNGLTWWKMHDILPPADLIGTEGYIATTVDKNNFFWVIAGGKIYRGRINRLGFARPDIY